MQNNMDVRAALICAGMKQWQLADALGVSESFLCRRLRKELSGEEKETMLKAIEKAKEANT